MAAVRMPGRSALAALLAALAFAAAGCSATDTSAPTAGAPAQDRGGADIAADGAAAPQAEVDQQAGAPDDKGAAAPNAPVDERSLIYTGSITIKVENVVHAADDAINIATGRNGFVSGDTRTIDADRSLATLVLRVPADLFSAALDDLSQLGTEESRQVQATDVTDTLVDLDSRIAIQEASVARIRDLLARAQTIGEITSLEGQLTSREADLESLKQRRAKAAGLVALATITVILRGPQASVTGPPEPDTGFLAGLREGWHGFLASVTVVLTVLGWLLPWAIIVGLPLWLLIWLLRRRRPRSVPPAPTA